MSLARVQLDQALADQAGLAQGDVAEDIDAGPLTPEPPAPMAFPSTEIGSLADLLGDQSPRRTGGVVCPCCASPTRRVVRVRPGGARRWVAACAMCAGKLLAGHPETLVGGSIRPRTRRAG